MRSWLLTVSAIVFVHLITPLTALAGMPMVQLTDVARLRLQAISLFLMGLLASAWGIQRLWNSLHRDFPRLPRLTYGKSLAMVILWGLLFIVVLTMISGARELMTPGAWEKQGLTYQLAGTDETEGNDGPERDFTLRTRRRDRLHDLGRALLAYAARHDGQFPSDSDTDAVPTKFWEIPAAAGARYRYVSGRTAADAESVLAYELQIFDDEQFVLLTDGSVVPMTPVEIVRALEVGSDTASGPADE